MCKRHQAGWLKKKQPDFSLIYKLELKQKYSIKKTRMKEAQYIHTASWPSHHLQHCCCCCLLGGTRHTLSSTLTYIRIIYSIFKLFVYTHTLRCCACRAELILKGFCYQRCAAESRLLLHICIRFKSYAIVCACVLRLFMYVCVVVSPRPLKYTETTVSRQRQDGALATSK